MSWQQFSRRKWYYFEVNIRIQTSNVKFNCIFSLIHSKVDFNMNKNDSSNEGSIILVWLYDDFNYIVVDHEIQQMLIPTIDDVKIYRDADECIDFITDHENNTFVLVISEQSAQIIIPVIHGIVHLVSVFVQCSWYMKMQCRNHYKDYWKVKLTFYHSEYMPWL